MVSHFLGHGGSVCYASMASGFFSLSFSFLVSVGTYLLFGFCFFALSAFGFLLGKEEKRQQQEQQIGETDGATEREGKSKRPVRVPIGR
jgi:hypothetical protein